MRREDSQQYTDSIAVIDMTLNDSGQERDRARRGNLSEHQSEEDARRGQEVSDHSDSGSGSVSIDGVSDVEVGEVVEATAVSEPVVMEPRVRAPVTAFSSMDAVNLSDVFGNRARVMRSVPAMLKGAFCSQGGVEGDCGGCGSQQQHQGNQSVVVPTLTRRFGSTQEVGVQIWTVPGRPMGAIVG